MQLEEIPHGERLCGGGRCPTLYKTDRGTFVVQGFVLDEATLGAMQLPAGEAAVEIPREVLEAAKQALA